ncbi:MAG: FeoB-associated Cys-rich membrane protein [Bacteroidales bacterium]|nr:FeoB-associated Cys-rich membrane protein [Bacteroidales bacterium]
MAQWILTILIVLAALYYAVYRAIKYFRKPKVKAEDCAGCSSNCDQCPLVNDLKGIGTRKN